MKTRIAALQKQVGHEALLIEDPTNLLYLTGLTMSRGMLVVTNRDVVLLVDGRYLAMAEKNAPCSVRLFRENDTDALSEWLREKQVKTLGFDSSVTTYDRFTGLERAMDGIKLVAEKAPLQRHRAVKDAKEISALKKAQSLTYRGFQHVESLLKEGVSEEEMAFAFEVFVRKNGACGLSFEPIVAFGENSAYPHHRAGKTRLAKNQTVLIDVGANLENYRGDLTRVVFFGTPDPTIQKWLHWTQQAQQKAIAAVKAGVHVKELDLIARSVFKEHGVEEKFTHGLGHGIGLETHEFPSLKAKGADRDAKLSAGMLITIEPGLYQAGLGGVRWEDMILVLENGSEKL